MLDPAALLAHPSNVRKEVDDLDGLAATIREVGVLEPLLVVPLDDGGHEIIAGHRRAAAAVKAEQGRVPCIERPDLADREQVAAMLVENLRRKGLSDAEEARGYQQLLDLGMSPAAIARTTGTKRARVKQALAVTASDKAIGVAEHCALTLEQAAVLTEFEDDKEAIKELAVTGRRDPAGFDHVASRLRQDRERQAAAYDRLVAEHREAGVRLVDEGPEGGSSRSLKVPRSLDHLMDDEGKPLSAEDHADCPDHAVWIQAPSWWQEPRAVSLCTNPADHGHRYRFGTGGVNKLPEEARAERREVIENNRAWRAAEPVRRKYIQSLLARPKPPACVLRFAVSEALADPNGFGRGSDELLAELTGRPAPEGWGRKVGAQLAGDARDSRLPLALLAQIAADREAVMDVHIWRQRVAPAERWLSFLVETGYTPSDIEQQVIARAQNDGVVVRTAPAAPEVSL
jgi:ParB family chromosome partitioning protein